MMILFSVLGGWTSGALGLGGGSIFNPVMISLGVPPMVSSSTSMYMIMYSSAASTIVYLTYGTLDFNFALWLSFWSSVGIMIGISVISNIVKAQKRQSLLLFIVVGIQGMSALMVPVNSSFDLVAAV
jgi:uncharacterized membrane protein YfcA